MDNSKYVPQDMQLTRNQREAISRATGMAITDEMYNESQKSIKEHDAAVVKKQKDNVSKALPIDSEVGQIGYNVDPNAMSGYTNPLRVESLDPQIKTLTYGTEQFIFFNKINHQRVDSTVRQVVSYDKHGRIGHALAMREGELSTRSAPKFSRSLVNMKYLSAIRQNTLQAELSRNIAYVDDESTRDAITTLAGTIEWMSFYGDKDLHSSQDSEGLEFDGLTKLIPKENVVDLQGKPVTLDEFNIAAVKITRAYGHPTDAFLPNAAKVDIVKAYNKLGLIIYDNNPKNVSLGFNVTTIQTASGLLGLNGSNLMDLPMYLDESEATGNQYKPVVSDPVVDSTTKDGHFNLDANVFADGQTAEEPIVYKVRLVAGSENSQVTATTPVPAPTGSEAITFNINIQNSLSAPVEYAEIYRSVPSDPTVFTLIAKVSAKDADSNGGKISFRDTNETIPGTVDAFVGDMGPEVITLYELLPIARLDLPRMSATNTWSFLWFGALALFAPRKWVRLHNVAAPVIRPQY